MQLLTVFSVVGCIFCALPQEIFCGLVGNLINTFNPFKPKTTTVPSTTFVNPITVQTKFISVEETVFLTAPHLQECFNPSDDRAKINYIVSPLSVINLLGQILIGTYGPNHNQIAKFLKLDPKKSKRDLELVVLTDDKLHDDKMDYSAFHWKFQMLTKGIKENEDINLENAFMYNVKECTKYFKENIQKLYKTELLKVDFENLDSTNNASKWTQFSEKNVMTNEVNTTAKALLFNRFEFNGAWDTKFSKQWKNEPFTIKPYTNISIRYIEGTIKNTIYISNNKFTLIVVPLENAAAKMYLLHPKKPNYRIRSFSESLDDFDIIKNIDENDPSNYRDVKLKIPNIFNYKEQMDIMEPIANYLESYTGKHVSAIDLNRVAKKLTATNLISQLSFSISNGDGSKKAESATEKSIKSSLPPVNFQIDSPFVFFIAHSPKKIVSIWGSISDPTKFM